jgi:phosphatidylserine decarboxylase
VSQSLEKWVKSHKKLGKISTAIRNQMTFFRDPTRPHMFDRSCFYSPADGFILYQKVVKNDEPIEIKGNLFNLSETLDFDPKVPCLCIGVFMTSEDVHINRIPYGGILQFRLSPPLTTYNTPMLAVENDILSNHFKEAFHNMSYERDNARMVNMVYSPQLDYRYYIVQIADDEINTITHFNIDQNKWFHQNDRFSGIRWGSQVNLILPIDSRYKFATLVPDSYHVEGGMDRLIHISHFSDV